MPRRRRDDGCRGDIGLVTGAGCLPAACSLGASLFSGEAAPGLGPAADFPFLSRQEREAKEGAGTPASAHFAQALRLPIPRTPTVSRSTVTVRDAAVPARLSSLRIAPLVVPAKAGTHCPGRHRLSPVRQRWASEQSEQRPAARATGRQAKRCRASSHTRARLCRATRGAPLGGRSEATWGLKSTRLLLANVVRWQGAHLVPSRQRSLLQWLRVFFSGRACV